jgi:putative sterol carrier protein
MNTATAPTEPARPRARWSGLVDSGARAAALAPPRLRELAVRGRRAAITERIVFTLMQRRLDRAKAGDLEAVLHWEIARNAKRTDRWQVLISNGRCVASRRLDREPEVTIKLDGPTFLDLVTGVGSGPVLFMNGRLRIEGDVMLAARLPTLFRVPQPTVRH